MFWKNWSKSPISSKVLETAKARGFSDFATDVFGTLVQQAPQLLREVQESPLVFDKQAQKLLQQIYKSGEDPREAAQDFAWLKRELGFQPANDAPSLFSKVIIKPLQGRGAVDGMIITEEDHEYHIVIGQLLQSLGKRMHVELIYVDESNMSSVPVFVEDIEARGNFFVIKVSIPKAKTWKKREHFRIATRIPSSILIRSDQAAFMPDESDGDFSVFPGELVNLSKGGGKIRLSFPVHKGDTIYLSFLVRPGDKPIAAEAQVVWANKEQNVWTAGFKFHEMDEHGSRALLVYLFSRQRAEVSSSQ